MTTKRDLLTKYNELEIAMAKEVAKIIRKYKLVKNKDEAFSNEAESREDEIYLSLNDIFNMKERGYLRGKQDMDED